MLKNGIVPRPLDSPGNWPHQISHPGFVYLTAAHAIFFACATHSGDRSVIFEIDPSAIPEDRYYPDEDYLLQLQFVDATLRGNPDWSVQPSSATTLVA